MAGANDLAKTAGKPVTKEAVDLVFEALLELIEGGEEKVIIRGFGTFSRKTRAGGLRRNPATGDKVEVPPKSVLHFKAAKETVIVLETKKKAAKKK